ncbi:hypothetical protein CMV_001918 [Castanea mollissima]|uniref:Uncharacterized protein n=1 Tax=Castanea mollissima TaxID=60419 RepID=A0A8J4VXJ2_9ROSI|nr:hypothetical protein CMV_001918 [Castanea mollissima]
MNFSLSHKLWACVSEIIHSFEKSSLLSQQVYSYVRLSCNKQDQQNVNGTVDLCTERIIRILGVRQNT